MAKILVVAECKDGQIKKPVLELFSQARRLGKATDAVLIGAGVKGQADLAAGHGAGTVYVCDQPALDKFSAQAYLPPLMEAVKASGAEQVWFPVSENSNSLAPALAGRMEGGFVGGATALEWDGEEPVLTRPTMATKVLQKLCFLKPGLRVISFRSGTFDLEPAQPKSAKIGRAHV